MHRFVLLLLPAFLGGCGSSWSVRDEDGDGKTILDGDCFDSPEGGADIGPDASEVWYDGIDQNCDGGSDFDKDGDGFESVAYGGVDCWDDPDSIPEEFQSINGFAMLTANAVHPDADDISYDAVDANCDGQSDFDADGDGFETANEDYRQRDGSIGDDCYDSAEVDPYPESGAGEYDALPESVNPGVTEAWYDGTDADCDGWSDYDQDRDGYNLDSECDDTNDAIYPNPDIPEDWTNDVDENCDGNTHDKDVDGFVDAAWGGDDCWDDYDVVPSGFSALNGFRQLVSTEVYPGASDQPYDGIDANCESDSDFDFDDDGVATEDWPARDSSTGTDCDDGDSSIYPSAPDTWYDGTDSDCVGDSDYDADGDGYDASAYISTGTDCDDADAAINPAPTTNEDCATVDDDNCDGSLDLRNADGCDTWYLDSDDDGYGTTTSQCWCNAQTATDYDATVATDCNDAASGTNPGATEICDASNTDEDCDGTADNNDTSAAASGKTTFYHDDDRDGYGDSSHSGAAYCDNPTTSSQTWVTDRTDCDDVSPTDYPGATETTANGDDEDCDGVDTCYVDADGDNYGTTATTDGSSLDCASGTGAAVATDCSDASASIYPGATEVTADGVDQDCDSVDTCYTDTDGDNYGSTSTSDGSSLNCSTGTGSAVATDCNDASASIYPGAAEVTADGVDQDCDSVDTCYTDSDGDNYGSTATSDGSSLNCNTGTGSANDDDCNDASASVYPGATEIVADGLDQDCDSVDTCYTDTDGDNYGSTSTSDGSSLNCTTGSGSVYSTDCNDASSSVYPGATETVADGVDQDCDSVDTCYTDSDGDNYGTTATSDGSSLSCASGTGAAVSTDCNDASSSVYPGATETVADGVDQDCDSVDTCYTDSDGDNYGSTSTSDGSSLSCASGTGAANDDDCNDASNSAYPGATETVADGIDQDCDSVDTCYVDADGDNYGTSSTTDGSSLSCNTGTGSANTTDCDDTDADINPGESDPTDGDLVDADCDDFYDEDGITDGDIVFTEFFVGAAGTADWVEIYNNSGVDLNLANWTFSICTDPTNNEAYPYVCSTETDATEGSYTLPSLIVGAGEYAVLCASDAAFGTGFPCDLEWSITGLSNIEAENGAFYIDLDATSVDQVDFWATSTNDWPTSATVSVQFSSDKLDANASITNDDWSTDSSTTDLWCLTTGTTDWAAGADVFYGSPGTANEDCTP